MTKPRHASTRTTTRTTGQFVRTTSGSRSLERGLSLLRAFRLGTGVLTNAELAARTALPRPTVSRLTRSLVDAGFLVYDLDEQGYRLGVVVQSLALAHRSSQSALDLALPLMRGLAEGRRINVGLAIADQTDMVYLDSVRWSRMGLFRRLVPGSRIPIAITSLGRAHLAGLTATERTALLARLAPEYGADWRRVAASIRQSSAQIKRMGYCWAEWQAGSVAIATPMRDPGGQRYALNISLPTYEAAAEPLATEHGALLMALAGDIHARWREAWS
ncbi:IclR family transcriptional regulator [Ottowia sp. GY511]|uniref:IclR family transcriptional regulator n=1 Tax=Ottowia flava TaxID=2675430 RepID=A0ABW4KT43_9BURK|nr:IclR family transcriptional regulator [Ottowia sp. GY511]TXK30985.1 IclR family transcriptional regulator [Ottowia sp. GY511]